MSICPGFPRATDTHCLQYWCTSVVSGLTAVGSLTGSRHRVPQGADGRVLDSQGCTHQQQHCLPGALHPAPACGSTSFTLMGPVSHRHIHNEISFWSIFHLHAIIASTYLMPDALCRWQMCTLDSCLKLKHVPINFYNPDFLCWFRTFVLQFLLQYFLVN